MSKSTLKPEEILEALKEALERHLHNESLTIENVDFKATAPFPGVKVDLTRNKETIYIFSVYYRTDMDRDHDVVFVETAYKDRYILFHRYWPLKNQLNKDLLYTMIDHPFLEISYKRKEIDALLDSNPENPPKNL